ncbi:MAG TPA: dihydrolipoamide acetyltransferase family protein, partial [Dehalococcoidia bacterium]|nr:dihydrolipoamide acetyltransferase family protein [Dehalococcoidia bacterium]
IAQQAAPASRPHPAPVQFAERTPHLSADRQDAEGQTVPFRGVRRTIADRMQHSLQSMAQLTLTMDVDTTEAVKMVAQVREEWRRQGVHLTDIDPIIKAVAQALTEYPRLNAVLEGDVIRLLPEVNIGIAIALEEGLIVPVVRQADGKSLREIAREVHELSTKAHAGTLTLDEVSGGTFTVTSLAAYDVDIFTPIINPPQAAILGMGRVREAPAFEGERVVRRMMTHLSLSFDHRVTDGAPAAQFLRRVRNLLERPYLLLF